MCSSQACVAASLARRLTCARRARFLRLRCFGNSAVALFFPGSHAPNNSFKPTPCPGFVETYDRARNTGSPLPRSARLNSGVRRPKAFVLCCFCTGALSASVATLSDNLSARSSSVAGRVRSCTANGFSTVRSVFFASVCCSFAFGTAPVRVRGALGVFGFGVSAAVPRRCSSRAPPRLTIRSSRRRVLASLKLTIVRAILAPHCRVRRGLTQALGAQKHLCCLLVRTGALSASVATLFG